MENDETKDTAAELNLLSDQKPKETLNAVIWLQLESGGVNRENCKPVHISVVHYSWWYGLLDCKFCIGYLRVLKFPENLHSLFFNQNSQSKYHKIYSIFYSNFSEGLKYLFWEATLTIFIELFLGYVGQELVHSN